MAKHKKNKNMQQLIAKRQRLEQLASHQTNLRPAASTINVAQPVSSEPSTPADTSHLKEIRHTLYSLVIILLLIGVSVYLNHKTSYFGTFGNWLYVKLRLAS